MRKTDRITFDYCETLHKLGKKGKCSWVGSKCHVVETAEKGKTNFITDMIYQKANEHDVRVHEQLHENNRRLGLNPKKLFVDSGYVSGESLKKCSDWGLRLMGYLEATSGPREKRFHPEGFRIDFEGRTAICPAGHRNTHSTINKRNELVVRFDRSTCKHCPFFVPCVRAVSDKAVNRILSVGQYYPYIRRRRIVQKTDAFRTQMGVRAQVEGTISEAIRMHGLRYARYHGKDGHQLQFYLTGAALNFNRISRAIRNNGEKKRQQR